MIRASFEEAGFETVPFGAPCDICVIHGCVVTARAEEDSTRLVRSIKRRCPNAFVVLAGCAAELRKDGKTDADLLANQADKFNLPALLAPDRSQKEIPAQNVMTPRFSTKRAIVKIQDGCDFRCSYCIVPGVRGKSRSRPGTEIIEEITRLTLCGFPEIVLTGVNIGCYDQDGLRLAQLLEKVEAIPGLKRFRISSLEPATAEREVIDFMASSKKMCSHLHLPLQNGSNRILQAMGRRYTAEKYCATVEYARSRLGLFGLGTDLIVGFPGETNDDFMENERLIKQLPFTQLHVFGYSPRPGTPAALMDAAVPKKEKEKRVARLIELGLEKRKTFAQAFIGKQPCFVVEKATNGWAEGWTGEYLRARVRSNDLKPRQIVSFLCERVEDDVLLGKI